MALSAAAFLCSAPLRWEFALRAAVGAILPLAIAGGGFFDWAMSTLVPIWYFIFIVVIPPCEPPRIEPGSFVSPFPLTSLTRPHFTTLPILQIPAQSW